MARDETYRDFVARGRPLRGQTRLTPLAERSTCSKSRIQPVVYYQCCILIGWRSPLEAKSAALKTKTMAGESRFAS